MDKVGCVHVHDFLYMYMYTCIFTHVHVRETFMLCEAGIVWSTSLVSPVLTDIT